MGRHANWSFGTGVLMVETVRSAVCGLCLLVAACGSDREPARSAPAEPGPPGEPSEPSEPAPAAMPAVPADPSPFPEGTRSLQLVNMAPVRLEPSADAKRIGTVAVDTRVAWKRTTTGKGCKQPWVEIVPRGWVCGENFKPTKLPPYGREVPVLARGEIVPGTYGKLVGQNLSTYALQQTNAKKGKQAKERPVTSPREVASGKEPRMVEDKPVVGSLTVRQYGEITVGGKAYWKISQRGNEYVLASAVKPLTPSQYAGVRLGDDTGWSLPIGFVWPRGGGAKAWTHHKPNAQAHRQLAARTPVQILETHEDKDEKPLAYRIGPSEWIPAADVRVYRPTAPPPLLRPHERWIDVDLDTQILVAFEGELAVYATMFSSGAKNTPTETGLYRVWLKEAESDMKNLRAEDPYSVATVPWAQFFYPEEDLALHTAYWHDGFGKPRSRGCVNLAPRDARWLYFWSDPQVPPGWTATTGVVEAPGSVVRVRSSADPDPVWKGYAKKVAEARQPRAPL